MTTNDYTTELTALIPDLEYHAVFVPLSRSRSASEQRCLNWRIRLKRRGVKLTTDYQTGMGLIPDWAKGALKAEGFNPYTMRHTVYSDALEAEMAETGKCHRQSLPAPDLADVLRCLLMDAGAIDYATFEDWASDLGMDTDSRKDARVYCQCVKQGLRLRSMLGDELMSKCRELLQDM